MKMKQYQRCEKVLHDALVHEQGTLRRHSVSHTVMSKTPHENLVVMIDCALANKQLDAKMVKKISANIVYGDAKHLFTIFY